MMKTLDEIQHPDEETLVSFLPLDKDDIIQACSPHAYEDEVSSLPLDEDVQTSAPPAHQEENMMSYNPFENFDDALFHDCGNEENFQKDLDEVSLAEGMNETLLSTIPFEEDEVVQSCEEVINFYDADEIMKQPPDIVDDHIDDFIQVGNVDGT
jgi:hypothetical protein